jgi:hypothetical protein
MGADGEENDLDIEAREKEEEILARARDLLEDDEDEVRMLKSTILQAQCQAVRDAQLREKDEIAAQIKAEEQRLDDMMEAARQRRVEEADAKDRSLKETRVGGRRELEVRARERGCVC